MPSMQFKILSKPLFSLPENLEAEFPGHYHTTVATIVQGELVPSAIGFKVSFVFCNMSLICLSH